MKKVFISSSVLSVAAAIVLSMTGCGGGSGGGGAPASGSTTAKGVVADGYIQGSIVCLDLNGNGQCDSGEPSTTTDANGGYTLKIPAKYADSNASIIATGGTDIDTHAKLTGALKVPFQPNQTLNITPLTTLVAAMVKKDVPVTKAYTLVAKAVGLTSTDIKANPVELNNKNVTTQIMATNSIITTLANVSDGNTSKIYSGLVNAIKSVADSNSSTNSIATIVRTAADENNTALPAEAKKAANVASVIENIVKAAIDKYQNNIQDAALASDDVVNNIQTKVKTAIKNKRPIDASFVTNVEENAHSTLKSADPVKIAVNNILTSYLDNNTSIPNSIKRSIDSHFTNPSDVNVTNILDLNSTLSGTAAGPVINNLASAYTMQQIKLYFVNQLNVQITPTEASEISNIPGVTYKTLDTMTKAEFSKKLNDTNKPDLMKLSFELSPPAGIASESDIQKAKNLLISVRTQANNAQSFANKQSQGIGKALSSIAGNVEFTSMELNTIQNMISYANDTNQTKFSSLVGMLGDRNITVSNADSSGNIIWNYSIKDKNVSTPWKGSLTFTNVDPSTFNPSKFTTLTEKLTGTMPLGYYGTKIPDGKTNSQSVDENIQINKTSSGATLHLDATYKNNGDSVAISNANVVFVYDSNGTIQTTTPKYVEVTNLNINGTVGNYTLNGKYDVKSYAVNKIVAAQGFGHLTTHYYFSFNAQCDNNSTLTVQNVKYHNVPATYTNSWVNYGQPQNTEYYFGWNNMTSAPNNVNDSNNYTGLTCSDGSKPTINYPYQENWTDGSFANSGRFPSEITFNGTLANTTDSTSLNANIDAKWTNIADANLSDANYQPNLNITANGTLKMPASAVMNVGLTYSNTGTSRNVKVTYVNNDTHDVSITADTAFDDNGTKIINLSSSSGIKATIQLGSNNKVDYANSSITNSAGDSIGTIEDLSGTPVVQFKDGSIESLY